MLTSSFLYYISRKLVSSCFFGLPPVSWKIKPRNLYPSPKEILTCHSHIHSQQYLFFPLFSRHSYCATSFLSLVSLPSPSCPGTSSIPAPSLAYSSWSLPFCLVCLSYLSCPLLNGSFAPKCKRLDSTCAGSWSPVPVRISPPIAESRVVCI